MKPKFAAALSLTLLLAATPVLAETDVTEVHSFSALAGVEAQALSQEEMDAMEGARITVADLYAAALAITNPTLQTLVTNFIDSKAKKLAERLAGLRKP